MNVKTLRVDEIGLTGRSANVLQRNGVHTVGEMLSLTEETISNMRNVGRVSTEEILLKIEEYKQINYENELEASRLDDLDYDQITIEQLELSVRSFNALTNVGIRTVAELLTAYEQDNLLNIPNIGVKSYEEIKETIKAIVNGDFLIKEGNAEEELTESYIVPDEIENISVYDLTLSVRLCNGLVRGGFNTVGKILRMTQDDMRSIHGMGAKTTDELLAIITELKEEGIDYFAADRAKDAPIDEKHKRTIDTDTVKKLKEDYGFKPAWLIEWYEVTRARIQQILSRRKNYGNWLNRKMTYNDEILLLEMVESKQECIKSDEGTKAYFLSNGKDDCAAIFVTNEEIKCFFMDMMPEYIQEKIKKYRLDCLTLEEFEMILTGKTVSIFKQEYFCPQNTWKFRQFAKARGMTTEDYCRFLTGKDFTSTQSTVNDEKLLEFLNAHYANGRLIIPSNNSTHWFRSFISRNGYSIEEVADLFGFGEEKQIEDETQRFETVEDDMQTYEIESEDWIDRVFAENPLIGNKNLSEKTKENLYTITKGYIDRRLQDSQSELSLKAKMEITLAIITFAKEWDIGDESGFWKYITTQFGYRDETNQLRGILSDCVLEATVKNRRWFISSATGYQYKSTIVVHALTTRRSWLLLYDFLFDFYKNNMEWNYIEGDPIIARMVTALRSKLIARDEAGDDSLEISTKVYSFQEGIRKLIIYRTGYAIKIIHHMLRRIDNIINHKEETVKMYVDVLCDQWFEGKLKKTREEKNRDSRTSVKRSVAIDYTRIRPVYELQDETTVFITVPDIRLKKTEFGKVELQVFIGNVNVENRHLSFYGNELGKTLKGFNIDINKCLRRGDGTLNVRFILSCDDEEIYNSEDTLFRNCLCFSNTRECDIHECEKGAYSFFAVGGSFDFLCSDVSDIDAGNQWKSVFAILKQGFLVKYDDQIMAYDRADETSAGGIRVVYPSSNTGMVFVKNGRKYSIVSKESDILLIIDDKANLRKCAVTMNSSRLDLDKIIPETTEKGLIYTIPLQIAEDNTCDFQVFDFEKNRIISKDSVKVITDISARFNRGFYYTDDDFKGAYINIVRSQRIKKFEINSNDDVISFPYDDGNIEIKIPRVFVRNNEGQKWDRGYTVWIKEIKQDEKIYITLPASCSYSMRVGDVEITEESKGRLDFGNAVFAYSNGYGSEWIDIVLKLSKGHLIQEYIIGRISLTERFAGKVCFDYHDNTLFWNRGQGFIGNLNSKLKLRLETEEGFKDFPINIEDEVIISNPALEVNEYRCSIVKESENIFWGDETILYEGSIFIGDQNELRFTNSMIEITNITYEEGDVLRNVEIKNTYIDQIEFQGIQFVYSEDRECPVYRGVMFYMGQSMKHHEFSFDEKLSDKGFQLYKINPVKIVFINEHTLSITNEEDDGIYYYRYYDKIGLDTHYAITDREPTFRTQSTYYLADLYLFRKERIE